MILAIENAHFHSNPSFISSNDSLHLLYVQELIFLQKFAFSVSTNEWKVEAVEEKSAKGQLFKIKLSIRKFEKRCKNLLIILLWFRGNAIYDFFLLFLAGHRLFPLLFSKKSKMTNRLSHSILFGIAIPSGPLSLLWTHANEVFRMFEPPFFVVIFLFVLLK